MPAAQQAAHEFVGALHDEGIGQQQQIGCGQGSSARQGLHGRCVDEQGGEHDFGGDAGHKVAVGEEADRPQ